MPAHSDHGEAKNIEFSVYLANIHTNWEIKTVSLNCRYLYNGLNVKMACHSDELTLKINGVALQLAEIPIIYITSAISAHFTSRSHLVSYYSSHSAHRR